MLRIRFMLIRIRIQAINNSLRFTDFFNQSKNQYFPLFLCLNLMNHSEKGQIWVYRAKSFFLELLVNFCPLDPDPLIRIFLRIQEAKILGIQRIRILSTA